MIRSVHIRGFKRFADQYFECRPLTVLAGMNGAGKTSLIHALLLVRESSRRSDGVVELNGPYGLELGGFEDVLNEDTSGEFSIEAAGDAPWSGRWEFSEGDTELYAKVELPPCAPEVRKQHRMFQYLSAERLGPRIIQGSTALPPEMLEVGYRGEFCAQLLYTLAKLVVDEPRRCLGEQDPNLLLKAQTELWLSRVTRQVQIDTENFAGTSVVAVKFRTGENWVKPTNMGFGITYALPVVLAGLTLDVGGVLIVENPEAHLHPAGQSEMGVFLATVAAAGVQVCLETHSDHVLNGIRRAIGERKILDRSRAVVHYFAEDKDPEPLFFTENGAISSWPKGFFDQYQLDVAALTRVRRPR